MKKNGREALSAGLACAAAGKTRKRNRHAGRGALLLAVLVTVLALAGCAQRPEGSVQSSAGKASSAGTSAEGSSAADTAGTAAAAASTTAAETARTTATAGESATEAEEEKSGETEKDLEALARKKVAGMSTEQKVDGLFVVTPEALTGFDGTVVQAGEQTRQALERTPVGGIILFGPNVQSREQLTAMLSGIRTCSGDYPPFLAVDEEGGTVARIGKSAITVPQVGSMRSIGSTGNPDNARTAGVTIGTYLSELGFDLDFAPVADVLHDSDNQTIGSRSFGTDAALCGQMVSAFVQGLESQGVSSCLKHFPGLGDTTVDTHTGAARSTRTIEQYRQSDFLSFRAGIDAGADLVMVSHLSAPAVNGDETPCSLSKHMITDVLRGELSYEGLVITDSLSMGAVTDHYTSAQAAVKAFTAGADLLLMPADFSSARAAVLSAVNSGEVSEERLDASLVRIWKVKLEHQKSRESALAHQQ